MLGTGSSHGTDIGCSVGTKYHKALPYFALLSFEGRGRSGGMVYARDSKSRLARDEGSSPSSGTRRETRSVSDWHAVATATACHGDSGMPRASRAGRMRFAEIQSPSFLEGGFFGGKCKIQMQKFINTNTWWSAWPTLPSAHKIAHPAPFSEEHYKTAGMAPRNRDTFHL